jgi:hypothetical protein
MPKFVKGQQKHPDAGRKKGAALGVAKELTTWCREMFEDPRYQMSVRQRLFKGRLPPQVECKLLAYAYGEPARDVTINANLRGLVSVIHEHIAAAPPAAVEGQLALPEPDCMNMHETVVERMDMHPAQHSVGDENTEAVE